jgi:hypothetical protein
MTVVATDASFHPLLRLAANSHPVPRPPRSQAVAFVQGLQMADTHSADRNATRSRFCCSVMPMLKRVS